MTTLRPADTTPASPAPTVSGGPDVVTHLCPYCRTRPAGLLAGSCDSTACRRAYLTDDARHVRAEDL